jgi:hypothetical protein
MPIMAAKQAPTTRISMEEIAVKGPKEPPTVAFGNNMPHPARKTINMEEIKVAAAAPKNKGKAVAKD